MAQSVSQDVRSHLMMLLNRSGLPRSLQARLLQDVDGGEHYRRVADIKHLTAVEPNSGYWGTTCACCCSEGLMVRQGQLGKLKDDDKFCFLQPGYHKISAFGQEFCGEVSTTVVNQAQVFGSAGFVTVTEGHIGVLLVGATYRLLAPGVYEWNSPVTTYLRSVDVTGGVAPLGPFTLVTIPDGMVAVTYHNGDLKVLGWEGPSGVSGSAVASNSSNNQPNAKAAAASSGEAAVVAALPQMTQQRTFFLDDPKWVHSTFLSLKEQTDKLEGNDLLSRDNVELLMVAMSQWRIVSPDLAVRNGAEDMEKLRVKVNQLVRATIARIVAGTAIGAGGAGTGVTTTAHQVRGTVQQQQQDGQQQQQQHGGDDADLAHLMQSEQATAHMRELSLHLGRMGVEVSGVYIPERYFKNDDLRREIARQSVIGIKAEAERSAADARAYATVKQAQAEAEAIAEVARAHTDAGKMLGTPENTAARMALSEITAKALSGANVTIFSGAPDSMPFMFTGNAGGAAPAARRS